MASSTVCACCKSLIEAILAMRVRCCANAKVGTMSEMLQESPVKVADSALERLSPGYFALVMGTGIVSVGLLLVGFEALSSALLWIAAESYEVVWGCCGWV